MLQIIIFSCNIAVWYLNVAYFNSNVTLATDFINEFTNSIAWVRWVRDSNFYLKV